jgi:glycosyltransferase involved in cell wall biosynthesis
MKYRIVYVWDADYPWDVRTQKICVALTEAGHDVHIVARNRAWLPTREVLPEGTVHRMPVWRALGRSLDRLFSFPAFFSPRWLRHIARVAKAVDADVIIARDLPLCPAAITVGKRLGIPVIFDMAENYPAMMQEIWDAGRQKAFDIVVRNPRFVRMVERWCLPRVHSTLTMVPESSDRCRKLGIPATRLTVVSNTPPRSRVTANWQEKHDRSGPLDLVYLGLLEIPRGVGELLEAVALLRDRKIPVRLKIVGDGRDHDLLLARARALKLDEDAVEFVGRLEHSAALRAVAEAQVGLVPHHADEAWNTTIPNKLFDYMAAGLAVVSSDAKPCARILNETGAGLVFRSGDANSLADAIAQLQDATLRRKLVAAGREAVLRTYNWESDSAALLAVVREAARSGSASRPIPLSTKAAPPNAPIRRKATR